MVSLFFGLLNLAILLVIIGYYVKSSFGPMLDMEIAEQQLYLQDLQRQHTMLESKKNRFAEKLELQRSYIKELKERIQLWQLRMEQAKEDKIEDRQRHIKQLLHKKEQQQEAYKDLQIKRLAESCILDKLEHNLEAYYQDAEHARKYTAHIAQYVESIMAAKK